MGAYFLHAVVVGDNTVFTAQNKLSGTPFNKAIIFGVIVFVCRVYGNFFEGGQFAEGVFARLYLRVYAGKLFAKRKRRIDQFPSHR